jgi:hypothetical protein
MVGVEFVTGRQQINDAEATTLLISLAIGLCRQRGLFDHPVAGVSGCGKKRRGASAAPLREVIFG